MKTQTGLFILLLACAIPAHAQWKTLPVPTKLLYRNNLKVETNQAENKTRITNLRTGEKEILDYCVRDHHFLGNYLCLKKVNVLSDEKTEVVFRIYQVVDGRFLRDIHLFRKTYDYAKVEFGEAFMPHSTYPKGKALFFVLYENCEWTSVGKESHVYYGQNLKQEEVIPLPDKTLGVWINDKATELTMVIGGKRVIRISLTNGKTVWELDPDNFSCDRFNYGPTLVLNRYLCIVGSNDPGGKSFYYIVDMGTGKILDTVPTDEIRGHLALTRYCKNLSKETGQE